MGLITIIIILSSEVYILINEENERNQLVYIRKIVRNIRNKTALKKLNKLRKPIGNSKIMKLSL